MKLYSFICGAALMAATGCAGGTSTSKPVHSGADTAPSVAAPVTFSGDSAYRRVAEQVALGPRNPGSAGHAACGDYIVERLREWGADSVGEQLVKVTDHRGTTFTARNIIARYNPGAGKRVLLAAHWDTRPWADNDPDEANHATPVPGANDGGSGTAVLLEMARLFAQQRPSVGVDLLFVDAEDSGTSSAFGGAEDTWCLGTQEWVKAMPYAADALPAYGILLDMVGGRDARFYREYASQQRASAVTDKVWGMAAASGFAARFPNEMRGAVIDDHLWLNDAGIPTVNIIEAANSATGSFPAPWHTLNDNLDNIDPATLQVVGQTVANVIYNEKP